MLFKQVTYTNSMSKQKRPISQTITHRLCLSRAKKLSFLVLVDFFVGEALMLLDIMQHRVECAAHRYLQYSSTEFLMWFDPKHLRSTSTYLFYIAYLKLKVVKEIFSFLPLVKDFSRRER